MSTEARADDVHEYRLAFTAGLGAYPRSAPVFASKTGTARAEGSMIPTVCWLKAEYVTNPFDYTSDVWLRATDGTYWPEVWLDTGSNGVPAGLRGCDEAGGAASGAVATEANSFYNRRAAVEWALSNASRDPGGWASTCAWFVSHALWSGGFPKDEEWTDEGNHGTVRVMPGSVTAWAVPELVDYLQDHYSVTVTPLTPDRFRSNAVPEAELGDLIVYRWDHGDNWDHFSMVTDIAAGQYPEVSEWGVSAHYAKRGWTYSINSSGWLQKEYPDVEAILIHINGGYLLPKF
jgi:hypothetical protein